MDRDSAIVVIAIVIVISSVALIGFYGIQLLYPPTEGEPPPTTGGPERLDEDSWRVTLFTEGAKLRNIEMLILDGRTSMPLTSPVPLREGEVLTVDTAVVTFFDTPEKGYLNSGDYYEVHDIPNGSEYWVCLLWKPSGNLFRKNYVLGPHFPIVEGTLIQLNETSWRWNLTPNQVVPLEDLRIEVDIYSKTEGYEHLVPGRILEPGSIYDDGNLTISFVTDWSTL